MSDSLKLAELFQQKVKELRAKDPRQAELLGWELMDYVSAVAAHTGAESTWDILHSQIQSVAVRQKISEEQVIHDLFVSGSAESFMLLLQLG